jgi:GNAT superfamily N-acetyltransferase
MSATDHLNSIQFRSQHDAYTTTHIAYFPGHERLPAGYASVNHLPGEPAELASLRVEDRDQGKGVGSALLDHVIREHPGDMELHASPFGNERLDVGQLRSFYARHGFQPDRDGNMRRPG